MLVRCKGCNQSYEVDEKEVDTNLNYIQCPLCGAITKNPFKKL